MRDIYFSPSRQSRKVYIPIYLSVLSAFARFLSRRYLFCVIYISRQAANLARRYSECILAPLAPLREHNTSCARTITSCEIVFSPSRQGCKDYAMENSEAYKLLTILRMFPSFSRTQLKFTSKPSLIPVKRRYVRVCLK